MPELPEVEALARFLRGRADGHAVTEVSIGAISALKTFTPPPDALVGGTVVDVQRHGKWLDLMVATPTGEPLH
ncbi:MAG: Fpg/Nei family DNA glycosylase, partial [Actinomycetales bacterium]